MDRDRTPAPATAAQDRRADVRAHVSQARAWTPDEATSRAAADFKDYHSPRLSQPGDADSMRHLREDMALRVRNSEPYRAELKRLDPVLTREVLAEPVSALGRQQPARQPEARQPDARLAEPGQNMIAALAGGRRMAEAELDAGQRATAKASIAANDRQADAKREVIDHMTPDELRRFVSAGIDRAKADPILKEAAQREEKALATAPARSADPPLNERFNVSRWLLTTNYEFRDQPGKTAFSERFGKLHTAHSTPTAAIAMIDRAAERGWDAVRVQGDAEFKRQVWIAAEARGIKAVGYEPTKGDISAAAAERQRLERQTAGSRSARPSHLERQPAQPRDAAPAASTKPQEVTRMPEAGRPPATPEVIAHPRVTVGKDPQSFTNVNAQAQRDWSDQLGITAAIEEKSAKGLTAGQVTHELRTEGRLTSVPLIEQSGLVIGTRATLGTPSQIDAEGKREFAQWKTDYDARQAAAAQPQAPSKGVGRSPGEPDIPSLAGVSTSRDGRDASEGRDRQQSDRQALDQDTARRDRDRERERQQGKAQGDEGADRAREKDRDKDRGDDRASGRGFGAAAFMRALEQVMEREGVPQSQRPQIRQIAEHQLSALRAQGKTPRVRLVDREAPRRVPQQLPLYDIKRTSQERAR